MRKKESNVFSVNGINQALIAFIIFAIPSNLFFKLTENSAYVAGLLIDYLIPKIYLSDIFILIFIGLNGFIWLKKNRSFNLIKKVRTLTINQKIFCTLGLILIIRQFFTLNLAASIYYLLRISFLVIFFLTLKKKIIKPPSQIILYSLVFTLFFQSILAIFQFHTQSSLASYYFLGEVNFKNSLSLNKAAILGSEKILPYGTTAHPNILGGTLVIFWLIASAILLRTHQKKVSSSWFVYIFTFVSALTFYALFLTQSISAWLTLFFSIVIFFTNKRRNYLCFFATLLFILTPLLINLFANFYSANLSLTRRANLNQSAIEMFTNYPLLGTGLNNFTSKVEQYGNFQEIVRFVQPVHHLGLLLLSETGLLGIMFIFLLWKKNKDLFTGGYYLLPIACLDHYLLTQQTGLLLLIFFILLQPKHLVKTKNNKLKN